MDFSIRPRETRDRSIARRYVESFDLLSCLKRLEVSEKDILQARKEYPLTLDGKMSSYDIICRNLECLVEPAKIVSMGRLDCKKSIYENSISVGELDPFRMSDALYFMYHGDLKSLYDWYHYHCNPVSLLYFSEDDIYSLNFDGTHRCLYAKLIGAPIIKAEVTVLKRNTQYVDILKETLVARNEMRGKKLGVILNQYIRQFFFK